MKRFNSAKLALSLLISTAATTALAGEFKGNWTETFQLKNGQTIVHTPNYVRMGFISAGQGIHIDGRSFNGLPISNCGLHAETDTTREEFVAALRCAEII